MFFEIYSHGKLIKRGTQILNELSWENELMYTPDMDLVLPIEYLEFLSGREEVKVFISDKCFWGIVVDLEADKDNETLTVKLEHVIHEWEYRQISVNNAIKEKTVNVVFKEATEEDPYAGDPSVQDQLDDIYADTNFAYPGWELDYSHKAENTSIDYVYSRQNKLEALTKTMELTPDLFWRVNFQDKKRIEISEFGDKKPYSFSKKPTGHSNIRIISDPVIDFDFKNVINVASVYSEKSDTGMSSMTLREVYDDPSLQIQGFPVVILRKNVNNERDYTKYIYQYPMLAPNNELEYAVLDEKSIALEGGAVIEGTFAFNDLSPFTPDKNADGKTQEITDADRIAAAKVAYHAAIRKLINARRSYKIIFSTEEFPTDLNVGDMVRFIYDNSIFVLESCSNYMKKVLTVSDWFYLTRVEYDYGKDESGIFTVTLEKELRIDRDTDNE